MVPMFGSGPVIAEQRDSLILWLPVLLGTGIGAYFLLQVEPPFWLAPLVMAGAAIALLAAWGRVRWAGLVFVALFVMALGWGVAQWRTHAVAAPVLTKAIGPVEIEGTIRAIDGMEAGKGSRVILTNLSIEKIKTEDTPHAVRINIRRDDGLMPGMRIRVLGALNPPSPPVMPGGYDFQRFAWFKRIGAFGFAYRAPTILPVIDVEGTGIAVAIERFRQYGVERVRTVLDEPESAIVSALLLGERGAISEKTWSDIRAAGLSHVIAISGLHIGLVAGGIFFVLRFAMALFPRFALYHPIRKYAAIAALVGAAFYAVMVGLTVPTVRAVVMTALVLVAIMMDRSPFSMRLVAVSALLILLTTPEVITGPSFQMSFAAVASLVFFYDRTRNWWSRLRRDWRGARMVGFWLMGMMATALVSTIATAPFTIYHFQHFPFYSVIGNILALPVISFMVMPAAVMAYVLMPLGLDGAAIWVMGQGVSFMLAVSDMIAGWPHADMTLRAWPLAAVLCLSVAGLLPMLVVGRVGWCAALVPLVAGAVMISAHRPPDILVAGNGGLAMVRLGGDVFISTRRSDRFTAQNWIRAAGRHDADVATWPREGEVVRGDDRLRCDPYGCHARIAGRKLAFSFDPRTILDDCADADILIARQPVRNKRNCNAHVIDMWALRNGGTHALYLEERIITVKTVGRHRGQRPWTTAGARR